MFSGRWAMGLQRGLTSRAAAGFQPPVRFLHPPAKPEKKKSRKRAGQEKVSPVTAHQQIDQSRHQPAKHAGPLENDGALDARALRPCLYEQRSAGAPFASDAQRGDETVDGK